MGVGGRAKRPRCRLRIWVIWCPDLRLGGDPFHYFYHCEAGIKVFQKKKLCPDRYLSKVPIISDGCYRTLRRSTLPNRATLHGLQKLPTQNLVVGPRNPGSRKGNRRSVICRDTLRAMLIMFAISNQQIIDGYSVPSACVISSAPPAACTHRTCNRGAAQNLFTPYLMPRRYGRFSFSRPSRGLFDGDV